MKEIKLGAKGYYTVYRKDAEGSIRWKSAKVGNIITNNGINNIYFPTTFNRLVTPFAMRVGTGTNEILENSTGLGSPIFSAVGNAAVSSNIVDNLDGTSTLTSVRRASWPLGTTAGTISEVGIVAGTSSGQDNSLYAGQLIKDEFGDPTTVTILSDEQLVVEYTLEFTYPNTSTVFAVESINIKGVPTDVTKSVRSYNITPQFPSNDTWGRGTSTSFFVNSTRILISSGDVSLSETRTGNASLGFVVKYQGSVFPSAGNLTINSLTFYGSSTTTATLESFGRVRLSFSPGVVKTDEEAFEFDFEVKYVFDRS